MQTEGETRTTNTDQLKKEVAMSEIKFEALDQGEFVVRFGENATSVAITWIPDDPEADPLREHRSLSGEEFDAECFPRCFRQCMDEGNPVIVCIFRCLAQCATGSS